ncbi:MAG: (2Fe-2S)-binding protein [Rhizobiaceae bacterium]|nr:MAG: (2Fe-2S)-binding protein [Rhizobiaceae bacterium]
MTHQEITLTVNGCRLSAEVERRLSLADLLREEFGLTGTHLGCEHGVCGACTVLVDGVPSRSCLMLACASEGRHVVTIEGMRGPVADALREAFRESHALQCGFCTPGMLATAIDLIARKRASSEDEIRRELAGNLCRCTGYQGLVDAILSVGKRTDL